MFFYFCQGFLKQIVENCLRKLALYVPLSCKRDLRDMHVTMSVHGPFSGPILLTLVILDVGFCARV